jgi:hypothetical protein
VSDWRSRSKAVGEARRGAATRVLAERLSDIWGICPATCEARLAAARAERQHFVAFDAPAGRCGRSRRSAPGRAQPCTIGLRDRPWCGWPGLPPRPFSWLIHSDSCSSSAAPAAAMCSWPPAAGGISSVSGASCGASSAAAARCRSGTKALPAPAAYPNPGRFNAASRRVLRRRVISSSGRRRHSQPGAISGVTAPVSHPWFSAATGGPLRWVPSLCLTGGSKEQSESGQSSEDSSRSLDASAASVRAARPMSHRFSPDVRIGQKVQKQTRPLPKPAYHLLRVENLPRERAAADLPAFPFLNNPAPLTCSGQGYRTADWGRDLSVILGEWWRV